MQNLVMTAPTVKGEGRGYWDWGEGRAAMVDIRDVVDSAVGALTGEAGVVAGETFVLTGPRAIGFAEVAEILSTVLDREIAYVPVPHEAAGEALSGMGLPQWIVDGYAELSEGFGRASRTRPRTTSKRSRVTRRATSSSSRWTSGRAGTNRPRGSGAQAV
jgi:uncharacterized protein YbjT (DUF2867 family)